MLYKKQDLSLKDGQTIKYVATEPFKTPQCTITAMWWQGQREATWGAGARAGGRWRWLFEPDWAATCSGRVTTTTEHRIGTTASNDTGTTCCVSVRARNMCQYPLLSAQPLTASPAPTAPAQRPGWATFE